MSHLIHDILGKITIIRSVIWEVQNRNPDIKDLDIASKELANLIPLVESLNDNSK